MNTEPTSMPANNAAPRSDSAATIPAIRRYGQPWAPCQMRVGMVATTVKPAPIHNCRRRSSTRGPRTAALASTASHSAGIRNLVCMLIAVTIPAHSSSRSSGSRSRRLRVQRTSNQHTTDHSAGSIAGVCSQWARIWNIAVAYAMAERDCVRRPPPSSAAISPHINVPSATAAVAARRSTQRDPGAMLSAMPAMKGTNGGWSKYPHDKWSRPATTK